MMIERLGARVVLLAVAVAMVFFGVGLIGSAIALALTPYVGVAGGDVIAGIVLLVPPILWAFIVFTFRRPAQTAGTLGDLTGAIIAALARETPWMAMVGAGLAGATRLFRKRHKAEK